jgi:hypothetical protein
MTEDIFNRGIKRLQAAFPKRSIIPGFFWEKLNTMPDKVFIEVVLAITKNPVTLHPDRDLIEALKSGANHIQKVRVPASVEAEKRTLEKWKAEQADSIPEDWTKLKNKLKGTPCQNPVY